MSFDESNQEYNQNNFQHDVNQGDTHAEPVRDENEITDFNLIDENEFSAVEIENSTSGGRVRTDYFYSQEAVKKMQSNLEVLLQCHPGHIISLNEALAQLDERGLLKQCVEKHGLQAVGTWMRLLDFQISNAELREFWL